MVCFAIGRSKCSVKSRDRGKKARQINERKKKEKKEKKRWRIGVPPSKRVSKVHGLREWCCTSKNGYNRSFQKTNASFRAIYVVSFFVRLVFTKQINGRRTNERTYERLPFIDVIEYVVWLTRAE